MSLPRIAPEKIKKILIVRPDAIGDMVLTLPAIQAIKQQYPHWQVIVLASKYNAPLIQPLPYIDEIIYDQPVRNLREFLAYVRMIKAQRCDAAVHFYCEPRTVWAAFLAGIRFNLGDKAKLGLWPVLRKYGLFYKSFDQPKHVVEYNFLLLAPLGITLQPETKLNLTFPPELLPKIKDLLAAQGRRPQVPLIGLHVGVGFGNRPLTPEKNAEFIRALSEVQEVDICLTGHSAKEMAACEKIGQLCQRPVLRMHHLTLPELSALFSLYNVYASVDTGPFHMAAALGVPQLAIFPSKKVKPLSWAPWRNRHFIVRNCRNCYLFCPHENCPANYCSDAIDVRAMVQQTQQLLAGEGYAGAQAQFEYWFAESMNILILFDAASEQQARAFYAQVLGWGLWAVLRSVTEPNLGKTIAEQDIAIIHNLAKGSRIKLFCLSQLASGRVHNPPLVVHGAGVFENKSALIEFYRQRFERKII